MDIENPQKNPEQNKEALFQSWLTEFKGRFWLNPDVIPEDVYKALETYKHFIGHSHQKGATLLKKCERQLMTLKD